jgi:hypothetical protein
MREKQGADQVVNSEGASELWMTARMLAEMLPGVKTERAWLDHAKREEWSSRKAAGGGRGRGATEFRIPSDVQSLIDAASTGKTLAATIREVEGQYGGAFINVVLLASLLDAVDAVAARKFDKALPTTVRLAAAFHAYRSMKDYGLPDPLDPIACSRLGQGEIEAAASLGLWTINAEDHAGDEGLPVVMISIGEGRAIRVGK